jgi:hypothetical protein
MASRFEKDPHAILDYQVDWSEWLGADTISTSTWTVPAGLTLEAETETGTTATVWLSGGTAGQSYTVTNRIVTDGGRTDDRSITIVVAER